MPRLGLFLLWVVLGLFAGLLRASVQEAVLACGLITLIDWMLHPRSEDDGTLAAAASSYTGFVRFRYEMWFNLVGFGLSYGLAFTLQRHLLSF